jgi:hypothetical protein
LVIYDSSYISILHTESQRGTGVRGEETETYYYNI